MHCGFCIITYACSDKCLRYCECGCLGCVLLHVLVGRLLLIGCLLLLLGVIRALHEFVVFGRWIGNFKICVRLYLVLRWFVIVL